MNTEIEELKSKLRQAYRKELNNETVQVVLTLNSYGFYTQIKERSADSLKEDGVSMRNIKGEWIK